MIVREELGPAGAKTIIFVHGAGVAGWMWKKQVEKLPSFRKIVVDLPDHGLDRLQSFVSIEAVADDLAALISERCPERRAHLVGHSLGAKIVLEILARRPGAVLSAVVSSALVRPSALASLMNSHALNASSLWILRHGWVARTQAKQFAFPDAGMTDAFLEEIRDMKTENLDRTIAAFCRRLVVPAGLENATCPVLITAGAKEPRSMLASVDDIAKALPKAKREILPGANHTYPWSRHEEYNRTLEQWFNA